MAKLIIKLIHAVGEMVDSDPAARRSLKVAFLPNYSVSLAEVVFPACELSEQISTAGTEASGTGNMKAALNGAVIIGTLDGANIEIREQVGAANLFTFGHVVTEIEVLRVNGYNPMTWVEASPELARVVRTIAEGELEKANPGVFRPIIDVLLGRDRYFHCADFGSYVECQDRVAETYLRPDDWTRMSIRNVAGMGRFSSDRTIRDYAREVWGATPVSVKLEA